MEQHSVSTREAALDLLRRGVANHAVAEQLCVPPGTIGWWLHQDRRARGISVHRGDTCTRCLGETPRAEAYSYLLGLYLGDGHIVSRPRQHRLTISCCDTWPGLITAASQAMHDVMPTCDVTTYQRPGCTEVRSCTQHWTCMFPQHGPGRKHDRRIVLEGWQQEIVDTAPWELLRGLVHSDGCRISNWTVRTVAGERKRYEYPRYLFANKSDDIRNIYTRTLTSVGVEWSVLARGRMPFTISVARRGSVALMDQHIGPKY